MAQTRSYLSRRLTIFLLTLPAVAAEPANVPAALQVKPANHLAMQAHGVGDQVYVCKNSTDGKYAWSLKAPDAKLVGSNGEAVGRHYAGPTWQATDGSSVQAKPVANVASPDPQSIPWLLLNATSHEGRGVMSAITQIQRLQTAGGKAPSSGCDDAHAGSETRVAYQADYYFYAGEDR